MAHMKWINMMIVDGTYDLFKLLYRAAEKSGKEQFKWDNEVVRTDYAKYVCEYVDKHAMPDYDAHLQERMHEPDFDYEE